MLSSAELGGFILVLANSMQDETLRKMLSDDINATYLKLKQKHKTKKLIATADDMTVFEALLLKNVGDLSAWGVRNEDIWQLTYNPLRALRPPRASSAVISAIDIRFDHNQFNFNKPFLGPEILWQGAWQEASMRVLYNKFPFVPYHLLLVVDAEAQSPQYLTREYHALAWSLVHDNSNAMPGFALGYNSLGAGASVNHLHFQGFIQPHALPVEHAQWQHNGGDEVYPLQCMVADSVEQCWHMIEQLHQYDRAYNLLYRNHRCYVLPRKFQGASNMPVWVRGAGWSDVCGLLTVSDSETFDQFTTAEITEALSLLRL